MKLGDTGQSVRELQALLLANDIVVTPDGFYGNQTANAVKTFQRKVGLHEDGIVGPLTLTKLRGDNIYDVTSKPVTGEVDLDRRTVKNVNSLDPKAREKFLPFIAEAKRLAASMGYSYIAISGNRGETEQNDLYAQGRTKPGKIVTNARFGESNHNFGVALDFGVFIGNQYIDENYPEKSTIVHRIVAEIAEKYGIQWGGSWKSIKDYPHFEIKTNLTLSEKRNLMARKGSIL